MNVKEVIQARGITEVVHFTTHRGLLGALHSGFVKSRQRLPHEVELGYIYKPNATYRKDKAWLDYVNLSISGINTEFFGACCRWHRASDLWWCVMSFDPILLTHPGVHFCTTNNMYTGVLRGTGRQALERLFCPTIVRWNGNIVRRPPDLPDNLTTCEQAEVLYPRQLGIEHLRRVYVETGEDQDEVCAQLGLVGRDQIEVIVNPDVFRMRQAF